MPTEPNTRTRHALRRIKAARLDQINTDDANTVNDKIISVSLDQKRITAAKFSSFI
jgi:hypothetical protein